VQNDRLIKHLETRMNPRAHRADYRRLCPPKFRQRIEWTAAMSVILLATMPSTARPCAIDDDRPARHQAAAQGDGFRSLFDGRSLDGWSGLAGHWAVEDGVITGQTTAEKPIDENTFLIWQGGELEDFELRLQFRIEAGNSGVQYRSQDLGNYRVGGYQADIDADHQYLGILYEERGRGILAQRGTRVAIDSGGAKDVQEQAFSETALLQTLRMGDWNEYVIQAQGDRLTQMLNGVTSVEVVDRQTDAARARGILALQLHAGPPMKVQFKDIFLKHIDGSSPGADSSDAASPSAVGSCPCCPMPRACRPRLGLGFRRCCR
jgi:hypothetical protein